MLVRRGSRKAAQRLNTWQQRCKDMTEYSFFKTNPLKKNEVCGKQRLKVNTAMLIPLLGNPTGLVIHRPPLLKKENGICVSITCAYFSFMARLYRRGASGPEAGAFLRIIRIIQSDCPEISLLGWTRTRSVRLSALPAGAL